MEKTSGYFRLDFKPKHISKKIKNLAAFIVDHECCNVSGEPIIGEDRDILIAEFAENMALGEMITRKKYLAIGTVIGITATIGVIKIQKRITKRKIEA